MKKKLAIVGIVLGGLFILVGILAWTGALGAVPSYPSYAPYSYDAGYAQFGADYYSYSVNNSGEAASAARTAANNLACISDFLRNFFGISSIILGLATGAFSLIVLTSSNAATVPAAPAVSNINYRASEFEAAEKARQESAANSLISYAEKSRSQEDKADERARQEAKDRAIQEAVEAAARAKKEAKERAENKEA